MHAVTILGTCDRRSFVRYSSYSIDIIDHLEHHTLHTHYIQNTSYFTYDLHIQHIPPYTHITPPSHTYPTTLLTLRITLHTYHTTLLTHHASPLTLHTTPPTHRLGLERDLGENFNPMSTSDADIAKFQECVAKFQRCQRLLECQAGTLCPNTIDKIRHVLRMKRHTIG